MKEEQSETNSLRLQVADLGNVVAVVAVIVVVVVGGV